MRDLLGRPAGPAPDNPRQALATAHLLGLTPLQRPAERCHRFTNGCVCADCTERAEHGLPPKPKRIRQPWEPLPLDKAA